MTSGSASVRIKKQVKLRFLDGYIKIKNTSLFGDSSSVEDYLHANRKH